MQRFRIAASCVSSKVNSGAFGAGRLFAQIDFIICMMSSGHATEVWINAHVEFCCCSGAVVPLGLRE